MPPSPEPKQKTAAAFVAGAGPFPPQAYEFIHEGLDYAVRLVHGPRTPGSKENRHVTGQQLCQGLRELCLSRWGRMARTVLQRWNITTTLDFGRIVFTLIDMGQMQRLDEDTIDDFKDVYDFKTAFECAYRIPSQS